MMALDSPIHLKQTEAFVNERPVEIVISRRSRVATASGGWKFGPATDLDPQTMRKVGIGRVGAVTERTTADGKVVIPTATMIGLPDVDIEPGDLFTLDGVPHEVLAPVGRLPEWRVSAAVYEHG